MKKYISLFLFLILVFFGVGLWVAPIIEHHFRYVKVVKEVQGVLSGPMSVIEITIEGNSLEELSLSAKNVSEEYDVLIEVHPYDKFSEDLPGRYIEALDNDLIAYQYEKRRIIKKYKKGLYVIVVGPFDDGRFNHGGDFSKLAPAFVAMLKDYIDEVGAGDIDGDQFKDKVGFDVSIIKSSEIDIDERGLKTLLSGGVISLDRLSFQNEGLPEGVDINLYLVSCFHGCGEFLLIGPTMMISRSGFFSNMSYLYSYGLFFLLFGFFWVLPQIFGFAKLKREFNKRPVEKVTVFWERLFMPGVSRLLLFFNNLINRIAISKELHLNATLLLANKVNDCMSDVDERLRFMQKDLLGEKHVNDVDIEQSLSDIQLIKGMVTEYLEYASLENTSLAEGLAIGDFVDWFDALPGKLEHVVLNRKVKIKARRDERLLFRKMEFQPYLLSHCARIIVTELSHNTGSIELTLSSTWNNFTVSFFLGGQVHLRALSESPSIAVVKMIVSNHRGEVEFGQEASGRISLYFPKLYTIW